MYVQTLVKALSQKYPQSVYYTMRAFLLERREQPDRVQAGSETSKLSKAVSVRLPNGTTVSVNPPTPPPPKKHKKRTEYCPFEFVARRVP